MDNYGDFDAIYAVLGGGLIIIALLVIAILVVGIIANWKMFKKAGKKGWECIVPFYSYWVLIEIAGLNWWWFLVIIADSIVQTFDIEGLSAIANIASLVASFNCYYNIAKKFNRSTGEAVCAGIFSYIFILIFGFSKNYVYDQNIPVGCNGIFGGSSNVNNNNNNINNQHNMVQSTNTVDMNNTNVDMNNTSVNTNMSGNAFCGNCGAKLDTGVKFCSNCGKENK